MDTPPDRQSHTPVPVSPPEPSASLSPASSRSTPTVSLVTALALQLAALALVFKHLPRCLEACLQPDPPPLAWKILLGMGAVVAIVCAPTPSLREAFGFARRFLPSREK